MSEGLERLAVEGVIQPQRTRFGHGQVTPTPPALRRPGPARILQLYNSLPWLLSYWPLMGARTAYARW